MIRAWVARYTHVKWALADQLLVSGSSFLTGVLLARVLGVQSYGEFALLYASLLYANTVQTATVIAPMMSILPKLESSELRRSYIEGVIAFQLVLSVGMAAFIGLIIAVLAWTELVGYSTQTALAVTALVLAYQIQDWLRRYYYSRLESRAVFLNDLVSYGGQLVVLACLATFGQLNVNRAIWAIALTSASAFCLGWIVEKFRLDFSAMRGVYRRHYGLGRDLLISGQIQWAGSQGLLMIAGTSLGVNSVGGIRAAQNILGPMNVINSMLMNVVPVHAAARYALDGRAGLTRYLLTSGAVICGIAFVFCASVSFSSHTLVMWLYGAEYLKYASLVAWGAAYWFLSLISAQFAIFHRTAETSRHLILASIIFAVASVIVTLVGINFMHETALFFAAIIGQLLMIAYMWWSIESGAKDL